MKNVIVIGGGIAGASITRFLSAKGIKVTLLEKSPQLCSGSTWHAAGLVTRFAGSPKLKKIHVRSLQLLTELEDKHGIGLHLPGSIRIIDKNNFNRLLEAKQHLAMAKLYDDIKYPTELISPNEIKNLHPLINLDNVEAGLYTPHDGDVDPTQLTNAVAKEAKENGANIKFNQKVNSIEKKGNIFKIKTDNLELESEQVVNCAGLWSRNISEMLDQHHPAWVIEHQYAVTEEIPEISQLVKEGRHLPVLRDLAGSSYIRQEQRGFLIGPYESTCIIKSRAPSDNWGMELYPDDLDRIIPNILSGIELIPSLGQAGFKTIVNGPTIWLGDSLPRCGATKIPGYFDFNSLTYGIAQSLALAEYLGYIMLNQEQPWDAIDYFDPLRYDSWANDNFIQEKISETYTHNNKIVYPFENRSAGLDQLQQNPIVQHLTKLGGQLGSVAASGAQSVLYYHPDIPSQDVKSFHHFPWQETVSQEAKNILENVSLGYSAFSKIKLTGDIEKFLKKNTTGIIPKKKNLCRLTYALTSSGQIQAEFSTCKINHQEWYLVGSREHSNYDTNWLQNLDSTIKIEDLSQKIEVLHLAGPKSKQLLEIIEPRSKDLKFLHRLEIENFANSNTTVDLFKVSFTGCLGYEIHLQAERAVEIFELIRQHHKSQELKLGLFGNLAVNNLRMEKGYLTRPDFDYSHYSESDIDMFVSKKRNFKGRDDNHQSKKKLTLLAIDTAPGWEYSISSDCPIINSQGQIVGYTTSTAANISRPELGKTIARGFIYSNVDLDQMKIESLGNLWGVTILDSPIRV